MRLILILLALSGAIMTAGCDRQQKAASGLRARVEVPRGQPFTLVVTRKTDQTCATEMLIPALNEHRALPLNQAVRIDVPNGVADTLRYACGMDMIRGMLVAK